MGAFGQIREGRVINVYPSSGTCDVSLEGSGHTISGVRMKKDEHPSFGDPAVIVAASGASSEWYWLCNPYEAGAGNPDMLEGAKGFVSPSGSRLLLHPDGTVIIGDSSFSQIAMIPSKRLLEFNVLRHKIVSPHGSIIWEPSAFNVNVGSGGQDVKLFMGSVGSNFGAGDWAAGREVGYSLRVGSVYRTEIAKDGGVSMVAKDVSTEVQEDLTLIVQGDTSVTTEDVEVRGDGADYDVMVGNLALAVEQDVVLDAKVISVTADLFAYNEADGPVMDGLGFMTWLSEHVVPKGGRITPDALMAFPLMVLNQKFRV